MTSPGPSPPRSKKESSVASETPEAPEASVVQTVDILPALTIPVVVEPSRHDALQIAAAAIEAIEAIEESAPEAEPRGGAAKRDAKQARHEAKTLARARRAEAREKLAATKAQARADAAAAKAAERVDSQTADQLSPQISDFEETTVPDELAETDELAEFDDADAEPVDDAAPAPAGPVPLTEPKARSRRERAKDDRIVEAPREPKPSFGERLRSVAPGRSNGSDPSAPRAGRAVGGRLVSALAGLIGAVGLICSVILAFGALLVALDADGGSVYDLVSGICDVLVGPLRDVFSFSGANGDMKEALVAWGAGAIIYLLVGVVAQSLLRSAVDD